MRLSIVALGLWQLKQLDSSSWNPAAISSSLKETGSFWVDDGDGLHEVASSTVNALRNEMVKMRKFIALDFTQSCQSRRRRTVTLVTQFKIGIRRALGASTLQTWLLLTREFGYLTGISILISWPISYFAMTFWLQSFVYHIEIPWWIFLSSSVIALIIALVTVSVQTLRTSLANSVQALRYD